MSQINAGAGGDWIELDEEADALFALCDDMHWMTRQTFDAAMLPRLKLWNWKADPIRIPSDSDVRSGLALCGWEKVLANLKKFDCPSREWGSTWAASGKNLPSIS